jgi:hypothetical protein
MIAMPDLKECKVACIRYTFLFLQSTVLTNNEINEIATENSLRSVGF